MSRFFLSAHITWWKWRVLVHSLVINTRCGLSARQLTSDRKQADMRRVSWDTKTDRPLVSLFVHVLLRSGVDLLLEPVCVCAGPGLRTVVTWRADSSPDRYHQLTLSWECKSMSSNTQMSPRHATNTPRRLAPLLMNNAHATKWPPPCEWFDRKYETQSYELLMLVFPSFTQPRVDYFDD